MPDPASPALRAPILSAKGICMAFDSVDVLKNVSLDLYPGEVHALVGENGEGNTFEVPGIGTMTFGKDNLVIVGPFQTFTKDNVDQFKF
jgi:ABC-type phosphonate transport system ATPase subunit